MFCSDFDKELEWHWFHEFLIAPLRRKKRGLLIISLLLMSMWLTWNPNRYCLLMLFSIFAGSTSIHQTLIFLLNKSKITFFLVLGSWLHKKIFFVFLNSAGLFFKEVGPIFVLWFLLCLSLKLNRTWLLHNSIFQIFEVEIRNY